MSTNAQISGSDTPAGAPAQARAFISYSRRDIDAARVIFNGLEARDVDAWIDWEGIPPSAEWWREVEQAIESSEAFVFVVSPESLASKVCRDEVAHALRHNKRLIPVVARDAAVHDQAATSEVAAAIARLNWILMRGPDEYAPGIDRLAQAIATDLTWVREHTRLLARAIEWQAHHRRTSWSLRGEDLAAAERWLAEAPAKSPRPTAQQIEYVLASRGASRQRRRRLLTGTLAAVALVSIAALIAGWQTLIRDARESEAVSRRLAAQAPLAFANDAWDLGLLLAIHAWDRAPTVEAAQALAAGLERMRGIRSVVAGRIESGGPLTLSPDGRLLAASICEPAPEPDECKALPLSMIDTATGRIVGRFGEAFDSAHEVAFDATGRRIAVSVTRPSNRVLVVELPADLPGATSPVALGEKAGVLPVDGDPVSQLAFVGTDELDGIARDIMAWRLVDGSLAGRRPVNLAALRTPSGRRFALDNDEATQIAYSILFDKGGVLPPNAIPELSMRRPPEQIVFNRARTRAAVLGCTFAASGRHCDGELRLIDIGARRVLGPMMSDAPRFDTMLGGAFLASGRWLVTGGCAAHTRTEACLEGAIRLWQVGDYGLEPNGATLRAWGGAVKRLGVSANGGTLVSASTRGRAILWSVDETVIETTQTLPSVLQTRLKPAASQEMVNITCHGEPIGHPELLAVAARLKDPRTLCNALPATNDGFVRDAGRRLLAVADCRKSRDDTCLEGRVRLWQTIDGVLVNVRDHAVPGAVSEMAFPPGEHPVLAIAHCPQRRADACPSNARIDLASLTDATIRGAANGLPRVSSMAWDTTATRIAFAICASFPESGPPTDGCAAGAIRLLDLPATGAGRLLDGVFTGHRNAVSAIAFDPAGGLLVSGDRDGRVAVWDIPARQLLGTPVPMDLADITSITFAEAGEARITTRDGVVAFSTQPQAWQRVACRLAGRTLGDAERRQWIGVDAAATDPCGPDRLMPGTTWRDRLTRFAAGRN